MLSDTFIREARKTDLETILEIYNQGIQDRIATLETEAKDLSYMSNWFKQHQGRYSVLAAEKGGIVIGWASLNPYSSRCSYDGVADLSVYIAREFRGKGAGEKLLTALELKARENQFHKLVLFTFPFNRLGQSLYMKMGFREVGIFRNQGLLDGEFVDVMAMEKLLSCG
ncbi:MULTISPECIES: arsinothricin resistance N-acetyltransferase ArsN1 family A [unclassified Cytobacillus]|uniref:arsinothricin resistance N-acetyltransferase ArsN1 family A n=1 Tax=unclassified Cytobacillus TaxID=2675268 RepID=UPI0013F6AB69|nr:arsinothricin resistance N-acetyltransferase ArsN1 family A [Cytobacillus sp. AMY 15.2]KAF0820042.1 Acetyltransferase, GNAT family [Bacillus sp. ZZV12-4809]MCM3092667.1 arsinothricin resistance N-acetyltransferase ArsN1 [Cytobacillus sp. AMY 15.2]